MSKVYTPKSFPKKGLHVLTNVKHREDVSLSGAVGGSDFGLKHEQ